MKIVRLLVENVKRVKTVEVLFGDNNVVVVGGKNEQGKSSILDALEYALAGKKSIPIEPIRRGEKKARVVVETDEYIITRSFTASGSTLTVISNNGAKFPSPQALLDKVFCDLSFDPLAFSRKASREQAEIIKQLVGLDFSDMYKARQSAYDERTMLNREVKALKSQIDGLSSENVKPVSVSELLKERERRQAENKAIEDKRNAVAIAEQRLKMTSDRIVELREELENIQEQIDKEMDAHASQTDLVTQARENASCLVELDVDEITEQIEEAESINAKAAECKRRNELYSQFAAKMEIAGQLTEKIDSIDKEKADSLADAKLPVDGLAFDDNGITVNDIPFDQCSSAEKLRVSVAMGLALNPELKLMQIRDGSLLDEDSLRMIREMAVKADAQIMIEKVTSTGEGCQVVIEDGEIKENDGK